MTRKQVKVKVKVEKKQKTVTDLNLNLILHLNLKEVTCALHRPVNWRTVIGNSKSI